MMRERLHDVAPPHTSRLPRPMMAAVYLALIVGALVMLFPFYWMVSTSFKDLAAINLTPPTVLPQSWHPENYRTAWNKPESTFGRYFLNSAIIAIGGTVLQLFCAILAAYAFARMDFPLKGPLFLVLLATLMIPFEVTLIPNFVTIRHMPLFGGNDITGAGGRGLYDSYGGIILPGLANAFSVFLLRQSFLQLPRDYWDAAQIDGASRWLFLWRVAVPLTMPTILTATLFALLARWKAVLWPLIITSSEELRPVQVAMLYFRSEEGPNFHYLMAAATLVALPGIVLYLLAQRHFTQGLASAGVKG
jgi:multiple sugar transport system permease protein